MKRKADGHMESKAQFFGNVSLATLTVYTAVKWTGSSCFPSRPKAAQQTGNGRKTEEEDIVTR